MALLEWVLAGGLAGAGCLLAQWETAAGLAAAASPKPAAAGRDDGC